MHELAVVTRSAAETARVARAVAGALKAGDVVLVAGDVGTGKSTFVRAACRALGVKGPIASPSFTIGRSYQGRLPVSHLDLFRLESLADEDPALIEDYLGPEVVAFVEWPEIALPSIDPDKVVLRLRLAHLGGDDRALAVAGDEALVRLVEGALAD